jgi:hypothetical protein
VFLIHCRLYKVVSLATFWFYKAYI